jgi:myosin heavy subunit
MCVRTCEFAGIVLSMMMFALSTTCSGQVTLAPPSYQAKYTSLAQEARRLNDVEYTLAKLRREMNTLVDELNSSEDQAVSQANSIESVRKDLKEISATSELMRALSDTYQRMLMDNKLLRAELATKERELQELSQKQAKDVQRHQADAKAFLDNVSRGSGYYFAKPDRHPVTQSASVSKKDAVNNSGIDIGRPSKSSSQHSSNLKSDEADAALERLIGRKAAGRAKSESVSAPLIPRVNPMTAYTLDVLWTSRSRLFYVAGRCASIKLLNPPEATRKAETDLLASEVSEVKMSLDRWHKTATESETRGALTPKENEVCAAGGLLIAILNEMAEEISKGIADPSGANAMKVAGATTQLVQMIDAIDALEKEAGVPWKDLQGEKAVNGAQPKTFEDRLKRHFGNPPAFTPAKQSK